MARRAAGLHNPGSTGNYPFLERYRVDPEVSHGHGGMRRGEASGSLGLRITGQNITIEGIDLPSTAIAEYAVQKVSGVAKRRGMPAERVTYHGYSSERFEFPGDGDEYRVSIMSRHNRGQHKQSTSVSVRSRDGGSGNGVAAAGGVESLVGIRVGDGPLQPLSPAVSQVPAGARVTVAPNIGVHTESTLRPPRGSAIEVSLPGRGVVRGTHDQPAVIPLAALGSHDPISVNVQSENGVGAPPVDVGFDTLNDGSTAVYASAQEPCRLVLSSVENPAVQAEGMRTCHLTLPSDATAVRVEVFPLGTSAGATPMSSQTVKLPKGNGGGPTTGPSIDIAEQPDGSKIVKSAFDPMGFTTVFSADDGRTWHSSLHVTAPAPQRITARLQRHPTGELVCEMNVVVAAGAGATPPWMKDLNRILSSAPHTPLAPGAAADPNQLGNQLRQVGPGSADGQELLKNLLELLASPPVIRLSDDGRSVKSDRHNLAPVVDGVNQPIVNAGAPYPIPTQARQVTVNAVAPSKAAQHVVASFELPAAKADLPLFEFRAEARNTITGVRAPSGFSVKEEKDGALFDVSPGGTVQVSPKGSLVLSMNGPQGTVSKCRISGCDEGAPTPQDDVFLNHLVKAIDTHKPNQAAVRTAIRPLDPSSDLSKRVLNGLVDLLSPVPPTIAVSAGSCRSAVVRFDNGAAVDALSVPDLPVPEGTKRIVVDVAAAQGPQDAPPSLTYDVAPGQLVNVRSDNGTEVFCQVGNGPRVPVPAGGTAPQAAFNTPTDPVDVLLEVERPKGTVAVRRAVRVSPAVKPPVSAGPLCIVYDVTGGLLRDVRVETVGRPEPVRGIDVYASVNRGPSQVVSGAAVPLPLPAGERAEISFVAIPHGETAPVAAARTLMEPMQSTDLKPIRGGLSLRHVDNELLLEMSSGTHGCRCSTTEGWSEGTGPGRPEVVRFDARSRHRATLHFTDASGNQVGEFALQLPAMRAADPPLAFELDAGSNLACKPLNGGVAVAQIGHEPVERSLATPVALDGVSPHTADIKLKRVTVSDTTADARTQLVATLRLTLRSAVTPQHHLRLLANALRSEPRTRDADGRLDHDTWLRDVISTVKDVGRMPESNRETADLTDSVIGMLLQLLSLLRLRDHLALVAAEIHKLAASQSANTVHFRLRGEQTLLVDPAPVA